MSRRSGREKGNGVRGQGNSNVNHSQIHYYYILHYLNPVAMKLSVQLILYLSLNLEDVMFATRAIRCRALNGTTTPRCTPLLHRAILLRRDHSRAASSKSALESRAPPRSTHPTLARSHRSRAHLADVVDLTGRTRRGDAGKQTEVCQGGCESQHWNTWNKDAVRPLHHQIQRSAAPASAKGRTRDGFSLAQGRDGTSPSSEGLIYCQQCTQPACQPLGNLPENN